MQPTMKSNNENTNTAGRSDRSLDFHGLGLTLVIAILIAIFAMINPRFLELSNFFNILTQAAPYIILAVGMTFVIATGGIDLSIGAVLAVASVVSFEIMKTDSLAIPGVALLFLIGAGLGALNGLLVAFVQIPPFIATLGAMVTLRGIALLHSAGSMHFGLSETVTYVGQGKLGGIPVPVLIALITAVFGYFLLNHSRFGVYCRALGGNREALRLAGVRVRLVEVGVYLFMGLMTALGGLVMIARIDSTQATIANAIEIHVIAAVIIGGTSLFGGAGSIYGSVAGAILLAMVTNALVISGADFFWQLVVTGLIVLCAVAIGNFREGRFGKSQRRKFSTHLKKQE